MRFTTSKVSHGILGTVPFLLALLGAVLANLSFGFSFDINAAPPFTLIVIFFWVARRPVLLPSIAVLFIGLWHDALTGAPLGLSSLLLLMARAMITEQNVIVFSQSFLLGWIGFAPICVVLTFLEWGVISWVQGDMMTLQPFLVQILLGVLAYPPIVALCGWLDYVLFGIRKG